MKAAVIWRDKRRPVFGKPWSFTEYALFADRIVVKRGLLREHTDILMLYRVLDISMTQTFLDKLFNVGTVTLSSADKSSPKMSILNVRNPEWVMNLISDEVENVRETRGIRQYESL